MSLGVSSSLPPAAPGLRAEEIDQETGRLNFRIFHATTSSALPGILRARALVPAAQLAGYGVKRVTGEGSRYRAGCSPSESSSLYLGAGRAGLGMARAYFDALRRGAMNPAALSDEELDQCLARARQEVEHEDPDPKDASTYVRQNRTRELMGVLEAERARRAGGRGLGYPLMFEFDVADFPVGTYRRGDVRGYELKTRDALPVEKARHVYVDRARLQEAEAVLRPVLNDRTDAVVLPREELDALVETDVVEEGIKAEWDQILRSRESPAPGVRLAQPEPDPKPAGAPPI